MTKKVMNQLNLRISWPYHNICSMDSRKDEILGVVKDLQVSLVDYPYNIITMDIAIIDVPDVWGMLLSKKFAVDLGGSIQMDLSYATISAAASGMVRLYREVERRYHVEVPKRLENGEEVKTTLRVKVYSSSVSLFFIASSILLSESKKKKASV